MIPIATTTVSILGVRPQPDTDPDADGYDGPDPDPDVLASNIRASITLPSGSRSTPRDSVTQYAFRCDLFNDVLTRFDIVVDEATGIEYKVDNPVKSLPEMFDLSHWSAQLKLASGVFVAEDTNESARD